VTSTNLLEYGRDDTLYLLDLHCYLHRFYATVGGAAAHAFIEFVRKILQTRGPAYFAVCTDLPFPTFRHEIAPTVYKAHRAKAPPDPTLLERLRWAREMVEDVHGLALYGARGFEADDLIATLATRAVADGLKVVILALDKDMMQLIDDENVIMWDPMKDRIVMREHVKEKFGIEPTQLRDYLAIVGDVSDNVPGIFGAGPKCARELLWEFETLDRALEIAGSQWSGHQFWDDHPRYRAMLQQQREGALLSQKLVTLATSVPIEYSRDALRYVP
jgi:DNA polymerase I